MASKVSAAQSRYEANPFLEKELQNSTMFIRPFTEIAGKIVEAAKAEAPVDEGNYQEGFEVAGVVTTGDGVAVRITNTDWKAAIIEFGTSEYPFSAPMRRGIERAGYTLTDDR